MRILSVRAQSPLYEEECQRAADFWRTLLAVEEQSPKSKKTPPKSKDKSTTQAAPPFVNIFDLLEDSDDANDNELSEFLRPSPKSFPESHLRGLDFAERAELGDSVSIGSDEPISSDEEVTAVDVDFVVGAPLSSESDGDYEPPSVTVIVDVSIDHESVEIQASSDTQEDSMVIDEEVP